ncbi:MAG: hypothetical protein M3419_01440 [Actinomycetota bacterium]|nr:hypothetical protein [Actinomycetota bacterium]
MNGWTLGYVIGAVVVAVVVVVLLLLINGARRTAEKAEAILVGLDNVRDGTAGLWQLGDTVTAAERIVRAAAAARISLTPGARP